MSLTNEIYFGDLGGPYWPEPVLLRPYFEDQGQHWRTYGGGNDNFGIKIGGLYGTGDLVPYGFKGVTTKEKTQVQAGLSLLGYPNLGVLLYYKRYGGGFSEHCFSYSDLSKCNQWVETLHGDLRPIGLFIPFKEAFPAVQEFMLRDGERPDCIAWVPASDLPKDTFPDPGTKPVTRIAPGAR